MAATEGVARSTAARVESSVATPMPRLVVAWLLLLFADVVGKMLGFGPLCRAIHRAHPARRPREASPSPETLCRAIDTARVYYFRRVYCLQSAAAAVCLLRLYGIPADLVIGVQRLPFAAHAWVESSGHIVMNDRPQTGVYDEIARF